MHGIDKIYEIGAQDFCYFRQTVLPMADRPYHAQDGLRLVRILNGHCVWHIDGRDCPVQTGDYLLFNRTESRKQIVSPGYEVVQEVIRFSPLFVWHVVECTAIFYRHRQAGERNLIRSAEHDCNALDKAFDAISCECQGTSLYQKQAVYGQLIHLLAVLNRVYPWGESGDLQDKKAEREYFCSSDHYRIVCELISYMQAHLDEDLSVGYLSEKAGISRSTLSRIFNHIVGISIPQYIRSLRLHAVDEMVTNKHINQLDAALACGFGSASGYYKARQETERK